jgi:hypothetical protein
VVVASKSTTKDFQSSSATRSTHISVKEPDSKRTKKASGVEDKQEALPLHIIVRTLPIHKIGANSAQCLDMIDRMYNIYYEIEVKNPFQILLGQLDEYVLQSHNNLPTLYRINLVRNPT